MKEIIIKTYKEYKRELDNAMHQAADAFVRIGYLLRKAKDTNVLAESGYESVNEFAKGEYGLSPDQVSRYIAINERFSVGGYAPELRDDMKGYGIGKLQIMLTLPDEVVEVIPPEVTKQEVSEIQKEVKKEQSITDIEVMLEDKQTQPADMDRPITPLEKFYMEYFYEQKEKWKKLYDVLNTALPEAYDRETANVLCPSGIGVLRTRIPGEGMMMLTFQGKQKNIALLNVRYEEKTEYGWDELAHPFMEMFMNYEGDKEEAWFNVYNEHFQVEEDIKEPVEKKEKIAPVQSELEQEQDNTEKALAAVRGEKESKTAKGKAAEPVKIEREKATEPEKSHKEIIVDAIHEKLKKVQQNIEERKWNEAMLEVQGLNHSLTRMVEEEQNEVDNAR